MTDGPGNLPRRARRRGALTLAFLALAGVLRLAPADAESVEGPAVVTREAYFTNPITQITPPLLRNGFPPATACLVAGLVGVPQLCGTEVQRLAALLGLSDGLPIPITPDGDLAQPVLPSTTPVGMIAGQQRYTSLVALGLPELASGETFASFELVLHQDGLNFAIESPAVRDVVLQIVAQLEEQDPQKVLDAVTRALTGEVPLATQTITGIEACPITQPWNGGRAQGANLDGVRLPDTNCLIGTTGVFDPAAATWTFDLTFAAQAWTQGVDGAPFANEGILLRPVGAPNLAYGDPDLSTNWLVSLADSTAAAGLRPFLRYSTVGGEGPVDTGPVDDGIDLGGSSDFPSFGTDGPVDFGDIVPGDTGGEVPEDLASAPELAGDRRGGSTPGWVWIALPLGLIAAYIFAQALDASPAATRRRPGALTQLEATRARAEAPNAPPGGAS